MKVCVLIPTYNEAKTIGWLIRKVKEQGITKIVIVDDGSTDRTVEIAKENGAEVLRNFKNLGKGNALKKGFAYCLEKNFDAVLTMDGDGQHSPEDIPRFLDFIQKTKVDLLIGNRMHSPWLMPLLRLLTNRFMSWIISFIVAQKIPDTQSGFRLIKRNVLEKIDLRSENFEIESEILIEAIRKGFSVKSLPIKTIYLEGSVSQINPLFDSLRFLKFILKTLWRW
ncbi:MAG: glycosyltransferase family 2 protein [Candidatus Omnitrophica bacterium]|nr:glycosyltransferase family 2 protein [Candidatus Omnitrophota bacterium]MCM8793873.1 glycosyltransferase family 2 protein [Candidatus Omnitrophota bacterium]